MVDRCLQCLQVAVWISLKCSFGILETMMFSAAQTGQVNRITYPALVPLISGRKDSFFI